MKKSGLLIISAILLISSGLFAQENIFSFSMKNIAGETVKLSDYKGKVLLIVNVASRCGLTPQYEGLEMLYKKYKDSGLVILGFPCNQFLGQEPGTSEEIFNFCTTKYNISFPLFEKIEVNGDKTDPLYQFLKSKLPIEGKNEIRWNFEKFLVDKKGNPVQRYAPKTKPDELEQVIVEMLNQK